MRARQFAITMAVATLIGAFLTYGEEPEEEAVAGKHSAPDAATRLSYADVISPPKGLEPWIHHSMPEAMRSKIERAFEIAAERMQQRPECADYFRRSEPTASICWPGRSTFAPVRSCRRRGAATPSP